jgi:hypothetical protein
VLGLKKIGQIGEGGVYEWGRGLGRKFINYQWAKFHSNLNVILIQICCQAASLQNAVKPLRFAGRPGNRDVLISTPDEK